MADHETPDQSRAGAERPERQARGASGQPRMPEYKGEPLDAERGPGLGCFWLQVILLALLVVLTPLSVVLAAEPWISAALLILTLALLFFVGQTAIFLMRLVAADRGTRRRPRSAAARRTVGQLEDETKNSDAAAADADQRGDAD